jgi:hypothetical protein
MLACHLSMDRTCAVSAPSHHCSPTAFQAYCNGTQPIPTLAHVAAQGRTSDPGTNASSHPAQGGSSPGTSRWFDAELGAAAANSTSSSGVHSRGVGAIAALVEAEGGGHKPPASVSAGSASEAPGQARSDSASASETLLRGSPQKAEMRPVTKRLGFCFRP